MLQPGFCGSASLVGISYHGVRNRGSGRCVGIVFVVYASLVLKSYCCSSKTVKSSNLFYYQNCVKRHLCGKAVTNENRKKYMITKKKSRFTQF